MTSRMPFRLAAVAAVLAAAIFIACQTNTAPVSSGIDLAGMDRSVAPGDDFNAYTNGGWVKATPIPADKASYGIGSILADETRKHTQDLIQEAAKGGKTATPESKMVGAYYTAFMDEAAIEKKGLEPLKPELDAIAAIADRKQLSRALGSHIRADVDPLNATNFETPNLFGVWVAQGIADPSRNYPYLLQGGLGMPDREYYLSPAPHMADVRKQYQAHIEAMFRLAGIPDPAPRALHVFALEAKMATKHATRVESEDVRAAVSWKREELAAKAPGIDWNEFLDAAALKNAPVFIVWHPRAIPGLSAMVAGEPLDQWKDWLTFHALEDNANYLPKAFVDERFHFRGNALSGIPELRPRWQRGVDFTSAALGDAVGKLYVARYFPPETKKLAQAMASDIIKAFGKRIDALSWMAPATKEKARAKLATLTVGVGYPDKWVDYAGLEITPGDALGNLKRADLFEYKRQLAKLNQPVDRGEWWMTPQTVNAVNLPLQNALNFPAAILQPPYFDAKADAAHNYGSMGAVIGHEISHSFDDLGSQFDAEGRLSNWWTREDLAHFQASGEALVAQFDAYRPFPDLSVNGRQTLSENIADVAGLMAAYDAYKLSLNGKPDATRDGFTGDQRFFISFGQSWREKIRDAELRHRIATDGHAPDQYRADAVRNLNQWYDAFRVNPAQKLYLTPDKRVRVW